MDPSTEPRIPYPKPVALPSSLSVVLLLWKVFKNACIVAAVILSLTCLAYLFYHTDSATGQESLPESTTTSTSTESPTTTEPAPIEPFTTPPSTTLALCVTNDCTLGCCSMDRRSCLVRCQNCHESSAEFTPKLIQYLSVTGGCYDIHLVLANCSTELRPNWLDVLPLKILSLSILMRLDSFAPFAFTTRIFQDTESLLLADVPIPELDPNLFLGLVHLQQLKLINIIGLRTSSISSSLFAPLTHLRSIEISEIPQELILDRVVGNYTALEVLTLNNDHVNFIYVGILSRLPNLIELNMVNSNLFAIYSNAFANLPKLLRINLSHNHITSFPSDVFAEIVTRPGAKIDITFQPYLICDCNLLEIKRYMQSSGTAGVFSDPLNVVCISLVDHTASTVKTDNVCDWGPLYPSFSNCQYCLNGNKLIIQ